MLIYIDLLSGGDIASDSYDTKELCDGAVLAMETKKVTEGDIVIDTGANASKEGEDAEEGAAPGDDGKETYINLVKSHSLMNIKLDKKEFKAAMKSYWKLLIKKKQQIGYDLLGIEEVPKDKEEAKAAISAAEGKLGKADKVAYKEAQGELKVFKARFDALQDFVTNEIVANFDEFDFYMPDGGELGECVIIPARYIGEATSPTFYFFKDGLKAQKE